MSLNNQAIPAAPASLGSVQGQLQALSSAVDRLAVLPDELRVTFAPVSEAILGGKEGCVQEYSSSSDIAREIERQTLCIERVIAELNEVNGAARLS